MNSEKSEIEIMIKSNFPKLRGIDFSMVLYNENINILNPIKELVSDVNGSWNFTISSSPMIFKSFSSEKISVNLEKLLLENQIPNEDKYLENENIESWDGDGFKIEKTLINEIDIIMISQAKVSQKSFQTFNSTILAEEINDGLDWIEGFQKVYNASTINQDLSEFLNVPFLFKGEMEHILIPINNIELGTVLIEYLILHNGGRISYQLEDLIENEAWQMLYNGFGFRIGIKDKGDFIRIEKKSSIKIHPLSKKIKSNIDGFNHQIFYKGTDSYLDGRFCAEDIECLDSVAFFENINIPIKIFKNIVLEYNNNDKFLTIENDSIIEIFRREPEGDIIFDVEGKFRLELTQDKSYYKLNLLPPGGTYGGWDELNEEDYNGPVPEVKFSYFSEEPVLKNYVMKETEEEENQEEKNEVEIVKEKVDFLENSTIVDPPGPPEESIWDKIIKFLPWLLLIFIIFLLLNNNSCNRDKLYYYETAQNNIEAGDSDKGIKNLDKAINIDREYIDAYMLRGKEYLDREEFQNAEYDFSEVISRDLNNWEAYYLRGRSYMGQAHNKWSPLYKKAIDDFTTSISLESSVNANSFYYRGESKEISEGERTGCGDFVYACDLGLEEGCEKYDEVCYPKTGFMPYEKYFGDGDHSGDRFFDLDNTQSTTDALVVLQNKITGKKVRSQFIRKGEKLTISNIPSGYYELKTFAGNNWTYDKLMSDGITRGGFTKDIEFEKSEFDFVRYQSFSLTLYKVIGGTNKSEKIDFNEFMK